MGKVQDTARFIENAWDAVEEMGGDVPANNKNLANLTAGIASIPQGPAVPKSLEELKKMVNRGREIAIGTFIPDDYNGSANPLIVVKNLDGTDNAYQDTTGNPAMGVVLQRAFVTDVGQKWDGNSNNNYGTSAISVFLNGDYLSRCSNELQNYITEIQVPVVTSSGVTKVNVKMFLPSVEEVYGAASATGGPGIGTEGSYFPYWKDKTGLSSPANTANAGRVVKANSDSGSAGYWWLRSRRSNNLAYAWGVTNSGTVACDGNSLSIVSTIFGVLPACFIGKD